MNNNTFFVLKGIFGKTQKVFGVFSSREKAISVADCLINKGKHGWPKYEHFEISSFALDVPSELNIFKYLQ